MRFAARAGAPDYEGDQNTHLCLKRNGLGVFQGEDPSREGLPGLRRIEQSWAARDMSETWPTDWWPMSSSRARSIAAATNPPPLVESSTNVRNTAASMVLFVAQALAS